MAYLLNTDEEQRQMLQAIGLQRMDQLFDMIPQEIQLGRPLRLPEGMGELELTQRMQELASQNQSAADHVCFLGAGAYDHFVPAVVDSLTSRGEFYTSYTPYQPEVSQGNLQVMFEYQSLICELTGMDVSNASLYDGGSAVAEAALMAIHVTRREGKVVVPETLHPEYRQILKTYLENTACRLVELPCPGGRLDMDLLASTVDAETACVILQDPNFFGQMESMASAVEIAHQRGALVVQVFDPIGLGILKRPGDWGVDIAVAEGQSLGTPLLYGGPYLGILACREALVRRMPGRIAGETTDRRGRRCWVLTLQTREQHIRRDKATSNICTNQGLFALRASIYLAAMGPSGLQQVAELSLRKAHYAAQALSRHERFEIAYAGPFFKEFVVRDRQGRVESLLEEARAKGYWAGVPLGNWYPELEDCFLVAVTEQRTRAQIDGWVEALAGQNSEIREVVRHA